MKVLRLTKRRKVILVVFVLTAIIVAYVGNSKLPQPPESVQMVTELDSYLEGLVNSGSPPGLSIVIVKHDSIVYSKGFGWADAPRNIKATPETVYHWWSITKIPTAMAILQLQEQGKLQLEDPVSKYLPFFEVNYPSDNSNIITILHLLNHSSGIPDASGLKLAKWIHHDTDPALDQTALIEELFPDYATLEFEPGENTAYTNIGYMVLGAIIEKVSGQNYRDYIRKNILEPLEMTQTDFVYTNNMQTVEAAGSHPSFSFMAPLLRIMMGSFIRESSNNSLWLERVYTNQEPPSALIGSTLDASRFMRAYLNKGILDGNRILSEASIELMTNDSHVANANDEGSFFFRRGIGWHVFKEKDELKLEHTGGGPGFFTIMQIYPSQDLGLVMFCNDLSLQQYGWKILQLGASLHWDE
ncbi:serine hydrolase domain-containing protein [Marinifilum caeruleilacunae]|uniref:Class A beta-lactamase-related serine hydrolase n=1 Tax=Marinifilum caeruleilacunae TaxID=2499076 RepID=A0ABX1WU74_9BACT|nr:serine hydrolase domain-containing protein [Marinifilum caeruleilacunae]NOU59643.1 class A beta-lactamase-related serine hydrolase [Marinifilum caeruleilacunae]